MDESPVVDTGLIRQSAPEFEGIAGNVARIQAELLGLLGGAPAWGDDAAGGKFAEGFVPAVVELLSALLITGQVVAGMQDKLVVMAQGFEKAEAEAGVMAGRLAGQVEQAGAGGAGGGGAGPGGGG
jgi:hypothetical protein